MLDHPRIEQWVVQCDVGGKSFSCRDTIAFKKRGSLAAFRIVG